MDFDSNMTNQIIDLIKDIFPTNAGRDYGLTFNEILNDVNIAFKHIYPDLPPIQPNQLQQLLKYQVNGRNQFDTIVRNDGSILYQIAQQTDSYNQYLFDYPSIYSAEAPPAHFVTPHIQIPRQIPQIHQQFIQPFHPQQIPTTNVLHSQPPPIQPRASPFPQQMPLQLQLQLHPTAISAVGSIPTVPIQNDQQRQQQQMQFQQQQIHYQQMQQQQQFMPTTVEELTKEIHKEQKRIEDLKKRQAHLLICNQLLQDPAQLKAVVKKMEQTVLYLKDMQSMVDDKVKDLVSFLV